MSAHSPIGNDSGTSTANWVAWADVARVAAIFGVIVIHACGSILYKFGEAPFEDWLSVAFLDSIVRCSVPIFVMLSGALLLQPEAEPASLPQIFRRARKVIVPLLFWNVLYLIYVSRITGAAIQWTSMFREPPMYHLWFAYMIVGLYFLLPIFQAIFPVLRRRDDLKFYFFSLWLLVTSLPIYASNPLTVLLQQTSLFGYGGYFLLGGLLGASSSRRLPSLIWAAIFTGAVLVTFCLTVADSKAAGKVVETAYLYFSLNVFVASVSAFVLLKRVVLNEKWAFRMKWMSDLSFLVFFIHVVVLERVSNFYYLSALNSLLPTMLGVLIISFATYVCCLIVASVLRTIPGAKHVVG